MTNKVKILFLAANPVNQLTSLRIDEELREIKQKIHQSTNRLELVSEWAVRASDLQQALLQHQPDIVHFSGHGSQSSEIILEDESGNSKTVGRKALSELFRILKDNIRVVVLNACYAKAQAQDLTRTIDFTVGINTAIEDKAAIVFSAYFYQSLSFGRSVKEAFELAINELALEDIKVGQVPELLVRNGANASESRLIIPFQPLPESQSSPAPSFPEIADWLHSIPGSTGNGKVISDLPVMRGDNWQPAGRHRSLAFLPWLFASIAFSLMIDIVQRFFASDTAWSGSIVTILQSILFTIAFAAAIFTAFSKVRPLKPLVEKAASLALFNNWKAALVSLIALVSTFALWQSLPVFARYYNERGTAFQYREQADLSEARKFFQQAVRLNPGFAQAHYNLARVQEDLQIEKAIDEYMLAIKYDSRIYPAHNNLARLYLLRGQANDYENALNLLNLASTLAPQDDKVQYSINKNLGWANYALKHYPLAEIYLRQAISLSNQQGAAAHCLLAYVLKEQGKSGVADECFDCVSLAPGEEDVQAIWLSDAQDCLIQGGSK
jgi:Tfp pilus assembly protein PilF